MATNDQLNPNTANTASVIGTIKWIRWIRVPSLGKKINYSFVCMVLMRTTVFMFAVIAATMASSVIPAVYAAAPNGRSGFGEAASEFLAKDGEMGDHAKSLDGNGDEPGKLGIGNVRDALGVDHVSDIPDELCSQDPANSACTSNDDDESSEDDDESSEDE